MVQTVAVHGKAQGKKPDSHEDQFNILLNNGGWHRVLFPKKPLKVTWSTTCRQQNVFKQAWLQSR
jgi:hypothetical protein